MKVAIIGTRFTVAKVATTILEYIPKNASEIVSGGADGVDTAAEVVANSLSLPMRRFLPDYVRYGRRAPLVRNDAIINYADIVLAFWDGESHGTQYTIGECIKRGKPVRIILLSQK